MLNHCIFMGRLVADPEIRKAGDSNVTCFRIACERDYLDKDNNRPVDFFDVQAWEKTGEFVGKYFGKGNLIAIEGRFENYTYKTQDGEKRYGNRVRASSVHFTGEKSEQAANIGTATPNNFDNIKFPGEE